MNRMILSMLLGGLAMGAAGCGLLSVERTEFPDAVIGADGSTITREELTLILDDPELSDDDKAQALRDLGIEDEELIAILVDL